MLYKCKDEMPRCTLLKHTTEYGEMTYIFITLNKKKEKKKKKPRKKKRKKGGKNILRLRSYRH